MIQSLSALRKRAKGSVVLFARKQIWCTNCGFFCWEFYASEDGSRTKIVECDTYWRNRIQTKKDLGSQEDSETGEGIQPLCLRRQWIFSTHIRSSDFNYTNIDGLVQPRNCIFYIKYQPSFSPEEHKELQREGNTTQAIRNATLWGAAIGAIAAILAQLLYAIITRKP